MAKGLLEFLKLDNKNEEKNKTAIINHYLVDSNGDFVFKDGHKISIPRLLRRTWLIEEENNIKLFNALIQIVCGEFSSTDTAAQALEKGYNVKVVCGAHILDKEAREKVFALKKKYGDRFEIYKYSKGDNQKPPYHSVRIGRNLFFENKHNADPNNREATEYDTALIVKNADDISLEKYNKMFEKYVAESEIVKTPEDIENMPLLTKCET